MFQEAKPWYDGQPLTNPDGSCTHMASGPSSYKPKAPEPDTPPPEDPPRQITFCPGDYLPDWMTGKVRVCLNTNPATFVNLCDGELLPENADGTVIVDPVTGKPTFNQKAKKPVVATKSLAKQDNEPTKEQVADGVCLWRNTKDNCFYTLCIEPDGSCTWESSDKGDTNTFATTFTAPAAGQDDYGNQFNASDNMVLWADGTIQCIEKKDEIGPSIIVDPENPATIPASSGSYEKQCLVDVDGNMVGFVDSAGSHFINDEDDEVGPNVEVDPNNPASWPTAPTAPHDLQFLCDANGVACAAVTSSGVKRFAKPVVDGGSNILADDGITINPLPDCGGVPIDVTAADARIIQAKNFSPSFTDGVSDANNPNCRTENVKGDDDIHYGPAPHTTYSAVFAVNNFTPNVEYVQTDGTGGNQAEVALIEFGEYCNPDKSREVCLTIHWDTNLIRFVAEAGLRGVVVVDALINGVRANGTRPSPIQVDTTNNTGIEVIGESADIVTTRRVLDVDECIDLALRIEWTGNDPFGGAGVIDDAVINFNRPFSLRSFVKAHTH